MDWSQALDVAWMLALVVAGIAHLVAKVKEQHLTGVELLAAVADAVVQELEQHRRNLVKGGLPDLLSKDLKTIAIDRIRKQIDVTNADAAAAVEAAVAKLPKSNLTPQPRLSNGKFGPKPP